MGKTLSGKQPESAEQPQLSIVVPIYNVEDWLEESLDSIYAICDIPYEVILVNDGATDNSPDIIQRYADKNTANTIVINKPNGGLSDARNVGLARATGDYVSFIDSDDFIEPQALSDLYKEAKKNHLDIALGTGFEYHSANQQQPLIPNRGALIEHPISSGKAFLNHSFENQIFNNITAWDKLYRRAFLEEHNFRFQLGWLHEDVPFAFDVFTEASKVKFFDLAFYYYRQRDGSIISRWNEKNARSWIKILNYICDLLTRKDVRIQSFDDYLIYQSWQLHKRSGFLDKKLVLRVMRRMNLSSKKMIRALLLLTKQTNTGEASNG